MKRVSWVLILIPLLLAACQESLPSEPIDAIQTNQAFQKGYSHYTDGIFGFSVTFPTTWSSTTSKYREATEQENSSPDSDIYIFIDGKEENMIRIYGQHGQIAILDKETYEATEFHTDSGLQGILYQKTMDSKKDCHLLFSENKHLAASIRMGCTVFNENKEKILDVLRSIQ